MEHRTCFDSLGRGCARTLPVAGFHRQGRNADGSVRYTSLCRDCNNEKKREWRESNPELVAAQNRRYAVSHLDEKAAYNRLYNEAHAEERRTHERERYATHRTRIRARRAEQRRRRAT